MKKQILGISLMTILSNQAYANDLFNNTSDNPGLTYEIKNDNSSDLFEYEHNTIFNKSIFSPKVNNISIEVNNINSINYNFYYLSNQKRIILRDKNEVITFEFGNPEGNNNFTLINNPNKFKTSFGFKIRF